MGPTKTQNCQGNAEEKDQKWSYKLSSLWTVLQSHSNQNSMLLAENETQINGTELRAQK